MASISIDLTQKSTKKKTLNIASNGYPVVTVKDNFTIEAKPNTFYDIKNNTDTEVNINFKQEEFYAAGKNKHIMFTFDGWNNIEELGKIGLLFAYSGGVVLPDTTREGYSYKMEFDLATLSGGKSTGILPAYFTDKVKTGNSVTCLIDTTAVGESEVTIPMNNIQVLNEDINYLVWVTVDSMGTFLMLFREVENDNTDYNYKYSVWGIMALNTGIDYVYTMVPYTEADEIYDASGHNIMTEVTEYKLVLNTRVEPSNGINEFVFNVNSPANVIFNQNIKWNNDNTPDLTKTGIYTISILNGVGCYTFVNS